MRQVLEAKKISLELKRMKDIKRSKMLRISSVVIFIIFISNAYYFKNALLLEVDSLFFIITPCLVGFSLLGSHKDEDQAFLYIMEALDLIDKGRTDPEVREHAAKKLEDATYILENLLRIDTVSVSPLWYSKVKELEKDFIRKLKYRAVPALRGGMLGSIRKESLTVHVLEHIALVFIESDTGQMKVVNDILENYDEIVISNIGGYRDIITNFIDMKIGKAVMAIIAGFGIIILSTWIGSNISVKFASQIGENLIVLFASGVALSVGFMGMLSSKS